MSAPAGWHLQPDGQERYWDGSRWTDQFRAPLRSDPTAPPPPPSWARSVDETQADETQADETQADETQALDVGGTQAMPARTAADQPSPYAQTPAQQEHGYPAARAGTAPAGYPQTGYGAPGGQTYAPPQRQGSGVAKGCLIAALVGVLVIGAGIVGAIYLFGRAADTISDSLPSGLPTDLPGDLPSGIPTEGLGQPLELSVGDGFELPRATVGSGWSLQAQGGGLPVVNVVGMTAEVSSNEGFPVLFTMSIPDSGGERVETVCTAPPGPSGGTVEVSCVPFLGDVADATEVTVTASL